MSNFVKGLREKLKNDPNDERNYHNDVKLKKDDIFEFKVYRQDEDPYGNEVKGDKIITGRTTYWSPIIQKD